MKKKKRLAVLLASACALLLTGCLFQSPEDLYQMPERSQGYTMLDQAIRKVKMGLEQFFFEVVEKKESELA